MVVGFVTSSEEFHVALERPLNRAAVLVRRLEF